MNLGDIVRARRNELRYGRKRFAYALYKAQPSINPNEQWVLRIENGETLSPSLVHILALAEVLELPIDLLVRAAGPEGVSESEYELVPHKHDKPQDRNQLTQDAYDLAARLTLLPKGQRTHVLKLIDRVMPDRQEALVG